LFKLWFEEILLRLVQRREEWDCEEKNEEKLSRLFD